MWSDLSNPAWQGLRRKTGAFTLIEILIVVVIVGIVAALVVPQFSNASHAARENVLKDELRYLRTQILVYRAQHRDIPPGYPGGDTSAAPTAQLFEDQLTKYTSELGAVSETASAVYRFGPYLSKLPPNPVSGLSAVRVIGNDEPMPAPDGLDYGWIYKPQTLEIIANLTGEDSSGTPFAQY